MEFINNFFSFLVDFLFFHQKSTAVILLMLIIVILIAFYINRKRDAGGNISFLDKSRTGAVGVRIFQLEEEGQRKNNWLIPLWLPAKNMLFHVKMILPKGEYEIKGYWQANTLTGMDDKKIFEQLPIETTKHIFNISDMARFAIETQKSVSFELTTAKKMLQIDCPDKAIFEFDPEKASLPLPISDPSFKKIGPAFEKAKAKNLWNIPLTDPRITLGIFKRIRAMGRKVDQASVRNRQMKSDLDRAMTQLKKVQGQKKQATGKSPQAKKPKKA